MKTYQIATDVVTAESLWDFATKNGMLIHYKKKIIPEIGDFIERMNQTVYVYEILMDDETISALVLTLEGVSIYNET